MRLTLIAASSALAFGFVAGWQVQSWRFDAAELDRLKSAVAARDRALEDHATRAINDAARLSELEGRLHEAVSAIDDGECLSADDARRLRDALKP